MSSRNNVSMDNLTDFQLVKVKRKKFGRRTKVVPKQKKTKSIYKCYKFIFCLSFIVFLFIIVFLIKKAIKIKSVFRALFKDKQINKNGKQLNNIKNTFETDKELIYYDRDIITQKMKTSAGWQLVENEPYFINGIVRKYKPKKCLEIGVASGGSAIIILNALKDVNDSFLISLDISTKNYNNPNLLTGYRVNQYFPELAANNKWRLFTGE